MISSKKWTMQLATTTSNSPRKSGRMTRTPPHSKIGTMLKQVPPTKLTFLNIKIICYPKDYIQFGLFRKKWQWLNYIGSESTHTPGTLRDTEEKYGIFQLFVKSDTTSSLFNIWNNKIKYCNMLKLFILKK